VRITTADALIIGFQEIDRSTDWGLMALSAQ